MVGRQKEKFIRLPFFRRTSITMIADGTGESAAKIVRGPLENILGERKGGKPMEIAVVPLHVDRDYLKMIHTVS